MHATPNQRPHERGPGTPPPLPPEVEGALSVEREGKDQRILHDVLIRAGLPPQAALEVIARYDAHAHDEELRRSVAAFTKEFGVPLDAFDEAEQQQATVLYHTILETRNDESKQEVATAIDRLLQQGIVRRAFGRIEGLRGQLQTPKGIEEFKAELRELLSSMRTLATRIPPDEERYETHWVELVERFKTVTSERVVAEGPVREVYDELFAEFRDFIEDELVAKEMWRRSRAGGEPSVEHVMREIYGRTTEEVEAIKRRNRERVTARIAELTEEPYLTVEAIRELHALNNEDLLPQGQLRFREHEEEGISFGQRFGTVPEDVRAEIEHLVERVNALIDEEVLKGVSGVRYEVAAAAFHNDLLDIHPFPDRNGSTALLLLELLMARREYAPPTERDADYYGRLRKVLNDNPVAIGLVAYEHFRIKYVPGYFEGKTTRGKEKFYDRVLEVIAEQRRAYRQRPAAA